MSDVVRAEGTVVPLGDDQTRAHLQVLVEGVATVAGFDQSAILLRRGEVFQVVAAASVAEDFVGTVRPVAAVEEEIERSDQWGSWRFVPHERLDDVGVPEFNHVPDIVPLDADNAWHPLDSLFAPIHDDDGELCGLLGVDSPHNGRLPSPETMDVLGRYAGLARTLVLLALEREQLNERVRIASEARAIVRRALNEPSFEMVLEACRSAVTTTFGASGMWLTAFGADSESSVYFAVQDDAEEPPFAEIDDMVVDLAKRYWADQYVAHFSRSHAIHPGLSPEESEGLLDFLDRLRIRSVLFVPLGVGPECVGFLVLSRTSDTPAWTSVEREAALDIGRDLGSAVLNARQLQRERALVERLSQLDSYRLEVVNTLAHELRNPLFAMSAHLELLDVDGLDDDGRYSVDAVSRGVGRMRAVIDDMLTMARVSDPHRPFDPVAVDLGRVVLDVLDECRPAADSGSITCETDLPEDPVLVAGEPDELERLLANLTTNAIKYTDPGGRVVIRVRTDGDTVVASVADTGLGISEADQEQLFQEYFRSTNPAALSRQGTGLGLAIVARIAARHAATIGLESERGKGTTMSVTLPAFAGTPPADVTDAVDAG